MSKEKRYFPNLNGIRCIAAMLVVFHHLEQAKHAYGLANFYDNQVVQHAGRLGVGLFFVLSGFLITYLLLSEKGRFGDVDTPKFYLRRVFRIWPIYFLIVGLSFFVFPYSDLFYFPGSDQLLGSHSAERKLLVALVLPNFAFVLYQLPYWCAQTWSIGVEEQFYYLWPWLIKYPRRRLPIILLFLAVTALLLFTGLYFLEEQPEKQQKIIGTFLGQFRIQTMALGGVCAYLVYSDKRKILDFIFRKDVQIVVYTLLAILFFSGIHFFGFLELYAFFFGFFILNASCNKNSIINLENPVMNHLGKISYGLYIYHVVVIVMNINLLRMLGVNPSENSYHFFLYLFSISGSIAVASLSYAFLEKPLLAYKDKKFGR